MMGKVLTGGVFRVVRDVSERSEDAESDNKMDMGYRSEDA